MKDPQVVLEGLEDLLERLDEAAAKGAVLVEGRRDEAALRRLGIRGHVAVMNQGLPILALCEELASRHRHVALLVDWDEKGDELAAKLQRALSRGGVVLDLSIRNEMRALGRGSIRSVEELDAFHRRVRAAAESKGPVRPSATGWKVRKEQTLVRQAMRRQRGAPPGRRP